MRAPCLEAAFCQSQECMAAMIGMAGIVLQGQPAQLQAWVPWALAILDRALSTCLCPLSLQIHNVLSDNTIWSAFLSVLAAWCLMFCRGCSQFCLAIASRHVRGHAYTTLHRRPTSGVKCICRTSSDCDIFEIGGPQFKL